MIPAPLFQSRLSTNITMHVASNSIALVLKSFYEATYDPAVAGDVVNFIIDAGIEIKSTGHTTPSLDTGTWPAGVEVNVEVLTTDIVGGGAPGVGPTTAARGGTAFKVRSPINLTYTSGAFKGGGGGGAGTDQWSSLGNTWIAGGGGGAGKPPGAGKIVSGSTNNSSGADGTFTSGGAGGNFGSAIDQPSEGGSWGGDGGALGAAGENGGDIAQPGSEDNLGGPGGYSIDGYSFVTVIGSAGTLIGPTNP